MNYEKEMKILTTDTYSRLLQTCFCLSFSPCGSSSFIPWYTSFLYRYKKKKELKKLLPTK